jgi:putative sterol carrier protein
MHLVSADEVDAPFVLRGSYANWKALMADGLDPVMAIVRGRLRLTGSLATIIRHVNAARALVDCARAVPTTFPDEPAPGT